MTEEQKSTVEVHLSILKEAMKQEGLIFGIAVDKKDPDNSLLCFIDKDQYSKGKHDGISVSSTDLIRILTGGGAIGNDFRRY